MCCKYKIQSYSLTSGRVLTDFLQEILSFTVICFVLRANIIHLLAWLRGVESVDVRLEVWRTLQWLWPVSGALSSPAVPANLESPGGVPGSPGASLTLPLTRHHISTPVTCCTITQIGRNNFYHLSLPIQLEVNRENILRSEGHKNNPSVTVTKSLSTHTKIPSETSSLPLWVIVTVESSAHLYHHCPWLWRTWTSPGLYCGCPCPASVSGSLDQSTCPTCPHRSHDTHLYR